MKNLSRQKRIRLWGSFIGVTALALVSARSSLLPAPAGQYRFSDSDGTDESVTQIDIHQLDPSAELRASVHFVAQTHSATLIPSFSARNLTLIERQPIFEAGISRSREFEGHLADGRTVRIQLVCYDKKDFPGYPSYLKAALYVSEGTQELRKAIQLKLQRECTDVI